MQSASALVRSCVGFGDVRDSTEPDLDYRILLLSLRNRPGMRQRMAELAEFPSQHNIKTDSWIPDESIIGDSSIALLGSAQFMLSGALVVHDIPIDYHRAEAIVEAAKRTLIAENHVYIQKSGFIKKEYHMAVLSSNALTFAFSRMRHSLEQEPNVIASIAIALEDQAKEQPKIKIQYF
jgi:hypothetical protein